MKKSTALGVLFIAVLAIANGQSTFGNWTLSHTGLWPTGPGFSYSGGDETFGISSSYGQISLQIDGGFRQHETGKSNFFMDKVGIGLMNPSVHLDVNGKGRFANNLKIFGSDEAWAEGLSIIKAANWSGIRLCRNDPATGNYEGNWALGYTQDNDFSIATFYNGNQYNGIFHISNSTRNIGIGTMSPTAKFHITTNTPLGVQTLNASTVLAIDRAEGGLLEMRNSADNNTYSGLLFTDNNLGGYVAFRNAPDDKLHIGGYGGISFEAGSENAVGTKTERMRIGANGYVGIGTTNTSFPLAIKGAQTGDESVLNLTNMVDQDFQVKLSGIGSGVKRTIIGPSTLNRFSLGVNLNEHLTIVNGGNIGIGTTNPDQKLTVNGIIHSKEVKIDLNVPGPDYVFANNYPLPTLNEIKAYIDQHKHLPEVPSAKEMEANGVNVGEMNMILLKKVEELTLLLIKMNNENMEQNRLLTQQYNEIEALKKLTSEKK